MSASPQVQDKAADKAHEPSMEEILASIRRIIADDQAAKPADAPEPEPAEIDDILDLAEVAEPVAKPAPPVSLIKPAEAAKPVPLDLDEITFEDLPPEPEEPALDEMAFEAMMVEPPKPAPPPEPAPKVQAAPPPQPAPPPQAERLISPTTDASVGHAFNLLAHTVLTNNARTLEDIVQDMLRPMLKEWLDDNLPVVVERLVRAEIERVSRGR
jgi:cell pole-organizing protein PopZ